MGQLSLLAIIFIALSYMAIALFFYMFLSKIYSYAITPSPLTIPTTPGPTTKMGVACRVSREVLLFESLFKGNKWTWVGGYLFHITFAVVIFRHLRYFLNPTPELISVIGPAGVWAGVLLLGAVGYLFARRLYVDRYRYISLFADYFALGLIGLIAITGLMMKFLFRTDVAQVKAFVIGIVTLTPADIPTDPIFILHYLLVLVLIVYIPFSKIMHMGGIFFSPTRAQVDDARENRRVNPWAAD